MEAIMAIWNLFSKKKKSATEPEVTAAPEAVEAKAEPQAAPVEAEAPAEAPAEA